MIERADPDAVRIAGGQGFYGDTPLAIADLLTEQPDYICLEALAELTLAILAKDRARDETLGYTRDLPLYLMQILPGLIERQDSERPLRVITNAGGINPTGAMTMLKSAAQRLPDLAGLTVALVLGDDLRAAPDLLPRSFPDVADLAFANAYLGVSGIVEGLEQGADIVITGRVADAALFLAPLVHQHGWQVGPDVTDQADIDRLAAGTVVGHLLECSGQSHQGGNRCGGVVDGSARALALRLPAGPTSAQDGQASHRTKPAVAGRRVDFDTSPTRQLLYEEGDPSRRT